MRQAFVVLLLLSCFGCGGADLPPFTPLIEKQPMVLSVTPQNGEKAFQGKAVEAEFSQPVDPQTLTSKSFFITAVPEGEVDLEALWRQVLKDKASVMEGSFEVSPDGRHVRFTSAKPFPASVRCGIVITPHVLSTDHLPISQTPGKDPTPFFSSFYALDDGQGGEPSTTSAENISKTPSPLVQKPSFLKLNEIFYDAVGTDTEGDLFIELFGEPLKNIGGYQIFFIRGSDGKVMDTLKIPETMKIDSNGFFVIADAITGQPGVSKVANAGWIINFDPPNGPDCIQLVDADEHFLDAVGYGSPLVLLGGNNLPCYKGSPAVDAPSGSSLSRVATGIDTENNAQDWKVDSPPTPGQ